jgi:exonuclease V gamma subunit
LYVGSKYSSLNTLAYSDIFFNITSTVKKYIREIGDDNITIKIEHRSKSSKEELENIRKNVESQLMHKIKKLKYKVS